MTDDRTKSIQFKYLPAAPPAGDRAARFRYLYQLALEACCRAPLGPARVHYFLEAACHFHERSYGLLLRRLAAQVAEVSACFAVNEDNACLYAGQHLTADQATLDNIFEHLGPAIVQLQPNGLRDTGVPITIALAAPLEASERGVYSLALAGPLPAPETLAEIDRETLQLLADGVAAMVDLEKVQAQRKLTDQAVLAMGSVKTLEEYYQQAELPEVYGIPARVVETLQRRIGQASLDIGPVAEDLNLSKRTLQRRLQQHDISFAELRDRVRFHYSLDYLVKQQLSIDSISATLDFSDRTSFTNAFKRWTGLSPSTFRKLFRDYA